MRMKTIKLRNLERAIRRGEQVAQQWGPNQAWMAARIEVLMLPGMWNRMVAGMKQERRYPVYDQKPERTVGASGRVGYALKHWNGGPEREDWPGLHSPSTCWDGIRRELYPSLAEALYYTALALLGRIESDSSHWAPDLKRWKIAVAL
mgnify:CR=1 FL=1